MLLDELSASRVLRVIRFSEPEQFRAGTQTVAANESIPLHIGSFAAARASLQLPRSCVQLVGTFPRILDGAHTGPDTVITLLAAPSDGALINGVPVKLNSIGILRGESRYSMVEKVPHWCFSLRIERPVTGRGWPEVIDNFALFEASAPLISLLRMTLTRVLVSASGARGDGLTQTALESMEETVLSALDRVFTGGDFKPVDQRPSGLHLELIRQIDARLASAPASAIYSDILASDLGVSVRSLHTATVSIRGMSLHRYLKIRRLWLVRGNLRSAAPGAKVKSFALAHGFWHLGDFSSDYQRLFGELPSKTLARASAG